MLLFNHCMAALERNDSSSSTDSEESVVNDMLF